MAAVETIRWAGGIPGHVRLIEQTLLPGELRTLEVRTVRDMVAAIRRLAVRGAPAIGVAAAYGIALGAQAGASAGEGGERVLARARGAARELEAARPTAVNLAWACRRMLARAEAEVAAGRGGAEVVAALLEEALAIAAEDARACRRMGEIGAELLRDGASVLTHCNAGALATSGIGTALAPIYVACEQGRRVRVYADETRPLLQGARLTAWELAQAGIHVTLIADGAAGSVLRRGLVDVVLVGADRIARNGDVVNKIGTYGVAALAARHRVPFYVVAPLSTFDLDAPDGDAIPIEERPAAELVEAFAVRTAPEGVAVHNPAFDVTPAELVTAIVTEVGRIEHPDRARIEAALARARQPLGV